MTDSMLISLAMLNVNWEVNRKSYIHNFVPFVADCVARLGGPVVSSPAVQQALEQDYGLHVPLHAVDTIMNAAAREGVVKKEAGVYVPVPDVLPRFDLSTARQHAMRKHNALVDAFIAFAVGEHNLTIQRQEAEDLLIAYLEASSLKLAKGLLSRVAPMVGDSGPRENAFVAAAFIVNVCDARPDLFEYLEALLKGNMLASAMYFAVPGEVSRRFERLTLLLDTNVLIHLLGYHGGALQEATAELTDLVTQLGGRCAYLPVTERELERVLSAAASTLRHHARMKRGTNSLAEFCAQNGVSASDLDLQIETLERDLRARKVSRVEPPPYRASRTLDEQSLESAFEKAKTSDGSEARAHDAQAVGAVHRFRGTSAVDRIETAKAVFVTSHVGLVRATREFLAEHEREGQSVVPHCILDHELTTIAWLKKPTEKPNLPRLRILADCYAALNPADDLWTAYVDEVERLASKGAVSEENYIILRHSVHARRALMELTRGERSAFALGTVEQVLSRALENATARERAELKRVRSEQERALRAREDAVSDAKGAEQRLEAYVDQHCRALAGRAARWARRTVVAIEVLAFALVTAVALLTLAIGSFDGIESALVVAGAVVLAALGGANLMWGTTLSGFVRRLEATIAHRFLERYKQMFSAEATARSREGEDS